MLQVPSEAALYMYPLRREEQSTNALSNVSPDSNIVMLGIIKPGDTIMYQWTGSSYYGFWWWFGAKQVLKGVDGNQSRSLVLTSVAVHLDISKLGAIIVETTYAVVICDMH